MYLAHWNGKCGHLTSSYSNYICIICNCLPQEGTAEVFGQCFLLINGNTIKRNKTQNPKSPTSLPGKNPEMELLIHLALKHILSEQLSVGSIGLARLFVVLQS